MNPVPARTLYGIVCLIVTLGQLHSAVVKKNNGETVEGEIQATITLKGSTQEFARESGKEFRTTYLRIAGIGILSVDQEGVRVLPHKAFITLIVGARQGVAPKDDDILRSAESQSGEFAISESTEGYLAVVVKHPCDEQRWRHAQEVRMALVEDWAKVGVIKPESLPTIQRARLDQQKLCTDATVGTETGPEATMLFRGAVLGVVLVKTAGGEVRINPEQIARSK